MNILEVESLAKSFDDTKVLYDISFGLEEGQTLSIIGSSGSGKTTLLRCLNFLEFADSGIIRLKGDVFFDAQNPEDRSEASIRKKDWCSSRSIFFRSTRHLKMSALRRASTTRQDRHPMFRR